MAAWTRVKWTEAAQIAELLGWDRDLDGLARASPEAYFALLRRTGRLEDAVFFIGQALPRYETVTWAARVVRDLKPPQNAAGVEADALKAALLWVQDPSDSRRRAAFDAANRINRPTAERLAALAVFFSGGSITPPDAPQVQAPKEMAGRFAAGAVLLASAESDRLAALTKALDAGAVMAQLGAEGTA
jgi:hypothetical protein